VLLTAAIIYTNLANSKVVEVPPPTLFNGVIVNEPQDPVKPKDRNQFSHNHKSCKDN
jgi:protein TonB